MSNFQVCFCIAAIHPFSLVNLIFLLASSLFGTHKKWHTQWSRQFGLRWIKFFRSRFTDTATRNELSVTTRIAFTEVASTPVTLHILKVLRPSTLLRAFIYIFCVVFVFPHGIHTREEEGNDGTRPKQLLR